MTLGARVVRGLVADHRGRPPLRRRRGPAEVGGVVPRGAARRRGARHEAGGLALAAAVPVAARGVVVVGGGGLGVLLGGDAVAVGVPSLLAVGGQAVVLLRGTAPGYGFGGACHEAGAQGLALLELRLLLQIDLRMVCSRNATALAAAP